MFSPYLSMETWPCSPTCRKPYERMRGLFRWREWEAIDLDNEHCAAKHEPWVEPLPGAEAPRQFGQSLQRLSCISSERPKRKTGNVEPGLATPPLYQDLTTCGYSQCGEEG